LGSRENFFAQKEPREKGREESADAQKPQEIERTLSKTLEQNSYLEELNKKLQVARNEEERRKELMRKQLAEKESDWEKERLSFQNVVIELQQRMVQLEEEASKLKQKTINQAGELVNLRNQNKQLEKQVFEFQEGPPLKDDTSSVWSTQVIFPSDELLLKMERTESEVNQSNDSGPDKHLGRAVVEDQIPEDQEESKDQETEDSQNEGEGRGRQEKETQTIQEPTDPEKEEPHTFQTREAAAPQEEPEQGLGTEEENNELGEEDKS